MHAYQVCRSHVAREIYKSQLETDIADLDRILIFSHIYGVGPGWLHLITLFAFLDQTVEQGRLSYSDIAYDKHSRLSLLYLLFLILDDLLLLLLSIFFLFSFATATAHISIFCLNTKSIFCFIIKLSILKKVIN